MTDNKSSGVSRGGSKPSLVYRDNGVEVAWWVEGEGSKRQNCKVRMYWKGVDGEWRDKSITCFESELKRLGNLLNKIIPELDLIKNGGGMAKAGKDFVKAASGGGGG